MPDDGGGPGGSGGSTHGAAGGSISVAIALLGYKKVYFQFLARAFLQRVGNRVALAIMVASARLRKLDNLRLVKHEQILLEQAKVFHHGN